MKSLPVKRQSKLFSKFKDPDIFPDMFPDMSPKLEFASMEFLFHRPVYFLNRPEGVKRAAETGQNKKMSFSKEILSTFL